MVLYHSYYYHHYYHQQGSFYKPLRRMGLPQILCVMGCFVGSGLFHAWPVYVSTFSLTYSSWQLMFFVANGLLVIAEKVIDRVDHTLS